jgi:LacI family transcriptional regulator
LKPPRELRIGCYVNRMQSYGLSVLRGIVEWSRTQPNCRVFNYQEIHQIPQMEPHGAILQLGHVGSLAPARALGRLPVINISGALPDLPWPNVTTDNAAVGKIGALHLLSTGLTHFAFARNPWTEYSRLRELGFKEALEEHAVAFCESFVRPKEEKDLNDAFPHPPSMRAWMEQLPRPCGIMADSESMAVAVTLCAARLKLRIPDDLALIAADQEQWLGELTDPPLSCVPLPGRTVGWRAAELLALRIREGKSLPSKPVLIPPEPVIVRQSSDLLHIDDPVIRRALVFIRDRSHERISVPDVARAAGVNRRALEIKFKTHLRCTILETIQRAHLDEALRLLRETQLSMSDICFQSGFPNPQRFNEVIKAETGLTPLAYRKQTLPG